MEKRIRVLLIDDDPIDSANIRAMFTCLAMEPFEIQCTDQISVGLQRMASGKVDVVLLDLNLIESQGLNNFRKASDFAGQRPIIVLSSVEDEALAVRLVREGAQDFLIKAYLNGHLLRRAILYAAERHHMECALRSLSLIDDLTGLYNRRGFQVLAEQEYRLATRTNRCLVLVFADLDDLKQINDAFGHPIGDAALVEVAWALKNSVRDSDIVARLGGDEFVALLVGSSSDDVAVVTERMQASMTACNARNSKPYRLALSVGTAIYDPSRPCPLDVLQARADALMYEQKRIKQASADHRLQAGWAHSGAK